MPFYSAMAQKWVNKVRVEKSVPEAEADWDPFNQKKIAISESEYLTKCLQYMSGDLSYESLHKIGYEFNKSCDGVGKVRLPFAPDHLHTTTCDSVSAKKILELQTENEKLKAEMAVLKKGFTDLLDALLHSKHSSEM